MINKNLNIQKWINKTRGTDPNFRHPSGININRIGVTFITSFLGISPNLQPSADWSIHYLGFKVGFKRARGQTDLQRETEPWLILRTFSQTYKQQCSHPKGPWRWRRRGNSALTPKGHEDGEEDRGRVVEQIACSGRRTSCAQLPVAAGFVT